MTRRIAAAGLALALGAGGCAWLPSPNPRNWFGRGDAVPADPSFGVEVVEGPAVVEFHGRAANFYGRLAHRRFNQIGTFRDEVLREYFRTERAFSDYYADFAQDLDDAHVDRNEPTGLEVLEFRFEGPGDARVKVRIAGANGLPLRPGSVELEREDRWERVGGTWWIVPGKL
jgi:hypothetical protein